MTWIVRLTRGWFAEYLFSRYRWFRRLAGGHWELWHIDFPVCSRLWLSNEHGTRPGLGRGTPMCEDWP